MSARHPHPTPPRIGRRALLAGGAALAAGSCLPGVSGDWPADGGSVCSWSQPTVTPGWPAQAGQVYELTDSGLTSGARPVRAVVAARLRELLCAVAARSTLREAWDVLLPDLNKGGQVVGIKVNALSPRAPTQPVVIQALVDLLREGSGGVAQASRPEIVVWDRRLDELAKAGITAAAVGAPVEGTWETAALAGSGRGYEYTAICLGGRKTRLSNILTRRVDHLINLAVVKRHDESGVTACLKNHYGSIDNPGDYHDKRHQTTQAVLERNFVRAIPGINALDEVAGKTRLWLIDATLAVCQGGTESPADCVPNTLAGGLDPVALDLRARQIRDEQRALAGLSADPETTSEGWLAAAAAAGLGRKQVALQRLKAG